MATNDIFTDRRSYSAGSVDAKLPCRRAANEHLADARPWWLKVNYLSRQFRLIENADFNKTEGRVIKK